MDSQNSFVQGERYAAYVAATNEKTMLQTYLREQFYERRPPISPTDIGGKRVLDLGCGTGANLDFLRTLFLGHDVKGIDRSSAQLSMLADDVSMTVEHTPFEDLSSTRSYDFVLVSHVLQYIDTDPASFISKVHESLNSDGEAWFVQQTTVGMYEIISSVKDYLANPRFSHWQSFADYVAIVDQLGLSYETVVLPSSIDGIDFKQPSSQDQLRLEFILCLEDKYQTSSQQLQAALSKLPSLERINHPNGVIKLRK